jgi:hypothetical protein
MSHKVDTYAELLRQIRNDLRVQHPDWIEPNGESPICDSYEARLIELLELSIAGESNENMVAVSYNRTLPNAKNSLAAVLS